MYINIENTGKFPLHYFLRLMEHPSVVYMTKLWPAEVEKKKPIITEVLTKKIKKSAKNDKYASFLFINIYHIYIYSLYRVQILGTGKNNIGTDDDNEAGG